MARIALLRGVNVGGSKPLNMSRLRDAFKSVLGISNVKTYVQSGNCVYVTPSDPLSEQEEQNRITELVEGEFGFSVPTVVRDSGELRDVVRDMPWGESDLDPKKLHVYFIKLGSPRSSTGSPLSAQVEEEVLQLAQKSPTNERISFHPSGRHIYAYHPNGVGASKFPFKKFEKVVGFDVTARNWNTITKLIQLAEEVVKESQAGMGKKLTVANHGATISTADTIEDAVTEKRKASPVVYSQNQSKRQRRVP
ncbi:hypothetical protein HDU93_003885 [Gonapodya sp. JEL0774]|nr:hypothetical protein HDU93_003885 [Gonapodya sp. JEL0774]